MATELFQAVKTAEAKAEVILKETETVCVDSERAMAREHRALYQSILEEKRVATQRMLDSNAAQKLQEMDERMRGARARLPMAVQHIAERVMSDGNR
ncbi:MAG: hypothetical protein RSC98_04745 [Clostridia bacterium]